MFEFRGKTIQSDDTGVAISKPFMDDELELHVGDALRRTVWRKVETKR